MIKGIFACRLIRLRKTVLDCIVHAPQMHKAAAESICSTVPCMLNKVGRVGVCHHILVGTGHLHCFCTLQPFVTSQTS